MVELSSVFLGKILGIREPLNLSKKQLSRYVSLKDEITEEADSQTGKQLLELFNQWYEIDRLQRTILTIEALEDTISANVDLLRDLHKTIEESIVGGKDSQVIEEFIGFAIDTYGAFEEFRLVTEVFQDIPSFTTLKGGLLEDVEEEIFTIPEDVLIHADTVFKSFQLVSNTVYALRGIDLEVKRGEFVAIMGPSGSGKTTLLNILSGLDKPDKGKVIVDGIDMRKASEKTLVKFRRNTASFIYQSYNLLPVLNSLENVRLPSDFGTNNPIGNKTKRAMELLAEVGLERFARTSPKNLSGGQQQRVTIARSLQNMPKIVFADEPTGDLDHKTGDQIMEILTNINKDLGVTLLVVTHDRRVAEMADRIVHMQDGKIIKEEIVKKEK
ncbi:MAG: ABC transporter ATP-binding protein [Methanobacteriota archaeon]|nr:MAG: ABC transporter ATP-binding protein [Euryarchaeota archaeon]